MAYKICPACGAKNDPSLLECAECEADLTGVELAEEETSETPSEDTQPAFRMVRVCECGHINPAQARKCEACHEDISDIEPAEWTADAQSDNARCSLVSTDGLFTLSFCNEELIVGRGCESQEYLSDKRFVSRRHARLYSRDGDLYIEDCASTNGTFVNNTAIAACGQILNDGDEIGLGGCDIDGQKQAQAAYFTVRINR